MALESKEDILFDITWKGLEGITSGLKNLRIYMWILNAVNGLSLIYLQIQISSFHGVFMENWIINLYALV